MTNMKNRTSMRTLPKDTPTSQITIRIPVEMKKEMKRSAKKEKTALNWLILECILGGLKFTEKQIREWFPPEKAKPRTAYDRRVTPNWHGRHDVYYDCVVCGVERSCYSDYDRITVWGLHQMCATCYTKYKGLRYTCEFCGRECSYYITGYGERKPREWEDMDICYYCYLADQTPPENWDEYNPE